MKGVEDTVRPVALVAAMEEEIRGIRRVVSVVDRIDGPGWMLLSGIWQGRGVVLIRSGPGRRGVDGAMAALAARCCPSLVLSFGFAGGLDDGLKAGDLVLYSAVRCGDGEGDDGPCHSDLPLLALAQRVAAALGGRTRLGTGVSVDRVVSEADQRRALRAAHGAVAVDMESYWVGVRAREIGVPFLSVRAISDGVYDPLPPFHRFFARDGRLMWGRMAAHFVAHPRDLARVPPLYLNVRTAADRLTRMVQGLVCGLDELQASRGPGGAVE